METVLSQQLGLIPEKIADILGHLPASIKRSNNRQELKEYCEALRKAGAQVVIIEHLLTPLVHDPELIAVITLIEQKMFEQAETLCDAYLGKYPSAIEPYLLLTDAYLLAGEVSRARMYCLQALVLQPDRLKTQEKLTRIDPELAKTIGILVED